MYKILKKIPYLLKNYLLPCIFCTGARWNIYYQIYYTPRHYRHLSNKTCTKFKKIYFHICWKTIRCHVLFAQELDGIFIVKFITHQDIIDNYLYRAKKKKSNIWREKRRGNYQRSSQGGRRFGTSKTAWASAPAPQRPFNKSIYIYRANMVSHNTHIHTYTYFNQYTPSYIGRKIHQPHHRRRPWDQEMQRRGRSEERWNGNDGEREKGLGLLGALSSDRQTGTVWRQLWGPVRTRHGPWAGRSG